jgi:deferrochelatase/peroxidase EfeB
MIPSAAAARAARGAPNCGITPPSDPDPAQVQRLIVYAYKQNRSRHFVLRVNQAAGARAFIRRLVRHVAYAAHTREDLRLLASEGRVPINIGFTFAGLEALELPTAYRRVFEEKAKAFAEGAGPRAGRRLADTGASAAPCWEKCFDRDSAHVLLSLYADEDLDLHRSTDQLRNMPGADGLTGWCDPHEAAYLIQNGVSTVHFGFRDGISVPRVRGFPPGRDRPKPHEPGEFLLGYWNDEEFNSWLLVNPSPRPNPWLPRLARINPWFFWNGSFGVLRKMEQNETAFRAFVDQWATRLGVLPEYVRAKLGGRWDDGNVVVPGQEQSSRLPNTAWARPADLNNFDFSNDRDGEGCPFGAHIRRMNPRSDPLMPSRKRPLIRRGVPYGPPYREGEESGIRRGLLGLFFCASLEDQFEHLLAEWGNLNPMGPDNRGNAKDPIVGNHENPRAIFDVPMPGEESRQLDGFSPFVTTRGTLYAFFPSRRALTMIATCRGFRQ